LINQSLTASNTALVLIISDFNPQLSIKLQIVILYNKISNNKSFIFELFVKNVKPPVKQIQTVIRYCFFVTKTAKPNMASQQNIEMIFSPF